MGEETCAGCRFWADVGAVKSDGRPACIGVCQRNPPAFPPDTDMDPLGLYWGRWPATGGDDFCGEYQPRKPLPVVEK